MSSNQQAFSCLDDLASTLRASDKKYTLIFAHNGTGKTRLSMAFKDKGKQSGTPDTLYFNAFTEDLFFWHNDLDNNIQRELRFNKTSHFFDGLHELEMSSKIRPLLHRYADFDFKLDHNLEGQLEHDFGVVTFSREVMIDGTLQRVNNIKISRGEENIFIWCFFLAVAQLAVDEDEAYDWVKYIYIDDPISSLDDNNAIAVASHLVQILKPETNKIKTVISTHHGLFFNVMHNELGKAKKYFLDKKDTPTTYTITDTKDTPFFHHVALIRDLYKVAETGNLYTYHFNILRNILEKAAAFHGFDTLRFFIQQDEDDEDGILHNRIVNILCHGNYSLFDPVEMQEENKVHFRKVLKNFMDNYKFNPDLFQDLTTET